MEVTGNANDYFGKGLSGARSHRGAGQELQPRGQSQGAPVAVSPCAEAGAGVPRTQYIVEWRDRDAVWCQEGTG